MEMMETYSLIELSQRNKIAYLLVNSRVFVGLSETVMVRVGWRMEIMLIIRTVSIQAVIACPLGISCLFPLSSLSFKW